MKDIKTKIRCKLNVFGTNQANANVEADLKIQDPDQERALAILKEALDEEDHKQEETS